MIKSIDDHVVQTLTGWTRETHLPGGRHGDATQLLRLFDAQVHSRHLDFAQRWLQTKGEGFYTIGSAGHESNAAVAMALRPTDPALLHYRSGGFYLARAAQVPGSTPIEDVLHGAAASKSDPISGGRHKVFGHHDLNVIPQTSTIGSHLPRAVGLAFALGRTLQSSPTGYPDDSVVVCSFGDASANHSTSVGALNAAAYCAYQGVPLPLLFVCEDNGIGISTRSPRGWVRASLSSLPSVQYVQADGNDPVSLLGTAAELVDKIRRDRRPGILHLRTVRYMGHAGSDAELAYRSRKEILDDYNQDPLLATAVALLRTGARTAQELLDTYEAARRLVMTRAEQLSEGTIRLSTAEDVMAPLTRHRPEAVARSATRVPVERKLPPNGRRPEDEAGLTLAQAINACLRDLLATVPGAQVFGEDVSHKGGVYGVTRGLRKDFGASRVFDTLLDEQTILGTALGAALAGRLPIPEIQYLAYLHNAEDQLRGEAASLTFFSDGQYRNGMVVRVAGLAYQKGFGGHFHNDNSVAVFRDIPGLALAVPSGPGSAPGLLRQCASLALEEGRVACFLEPIALYHERDLHQTGDAAFLARYPAPGAVEVKDQAVGRARVVESGRDVLLVTFGNGVRMCLRAARRLRLQEISCGVLDLQWLVPLPLDDLLAAAHAYPQVLVVDETRASGGVSEAVVSALIDGGYLGQVGRVNSRDSFVPLGPAADSVLLSEEHIVEKTYGLLELGHREQEA